jgi:hypothetical protein
VQIINLIEAYRPNVLAFNFGISEPFWDDKAKHLESYVASAWPLNRTGRRFWFGFCQKLGISFWKGDSLSRRGTRVVEWLGDELGNDRIMVILASESDARRWLSIHQVIRKPFDVILYDLVSRENPSASTLPHLSEAIRHAHQVLTISPALSEAVVAMGRDDSRRIGFYRQPPLGYSGLCLSARRLEQSQKIHVLVMAYAHPDALEEFISTLVALNAKNPIWNAHLVGGIPLPSRLSRHPDWVHSYGRVSDAKRDQIAASCDLAYLSGPSDDPTKCPYAKYSIPSKISDFLTFGLPVIARVSSGSGIEQFLRNELGNIACVATDRNELTKLLSALQDSPEMVCEMRSCALNKAREDVLLPDAANWLFAGARSDP